MPLTEIVFCQKTLIPLISNLKSRRYFSPFSGERMQARHGRGREGGCEAPHTRAKNNVCQNVCSHCRVLREAGTWGLKKNSKMAAVNQRGFFYRVSSISKVCGHCLFELQSSIVLFFDVPLVFFGSLLIFSLGFLHCLCFFIFCISQEYEIRLIIC